MQLKTFPTTLVDEISSFLRSSSSDPRGDSYSNAEDWVVRTVKFVEPQKRDQIHIVLQHERHRITVKLIASDFPRRIRMPNTGSYSNLAFYISLLLEEQVLGKSERLGGVNSMVLK